MRDYYYPNGFNLMFLTSPSTPFRKDSSWGPCPWGLRQQQNFVAANGLYSKKKSYSHGDLWQQCVISTLQLNRFIIYSLDFFPKSAEISVNSGNRINQWSMNWSQFKDRVSNMCLAGAVVVVVCWSLTQELAGSIPFNVMINIFVTDSVKAFRKNWIVAESTPKNFVFDAETRSSYQFQDSALSSLVTYIPTQNKC